MCFIRDEFIKYNIVYYIENIYMYDTDSKTSYGSFLLLNLCVIFIHCPDSDTWRSQLSVNLDVNCIFSCFVLFRYFFFFFFLFLGWILTFLHILCKFFWYPSLTSSVAWNLKFPTFILCIFFNSLFFSIKMAWQQFFLKVAKCNNLQLRL